MKNIPTPLEANKRTPKQKTSLGAAPSWHRNVRNIAVATALSIASVAHGAPPDPHAKKAKPQIHAAESYVEFRKMPPGKFYEIILRDPSKLIKVVQHMETIKLNKPYNNPYVEIMYIITQWANSPKEKKIPDVERILFLIAEKYPHIIINFSNDIRDNKDPRIAAIYAKVIQKAFGILQKNDPESAKWIMKHGGKYLPLKK